jgi:hypothetical protein
LGDDSLKFSGHSACLGKLAKEEAKKDDAENLESILRGGGLGLLLWQLG